MSDTPTMAQRPSRFQQALAADVDRLHAHLFPEDPVEDFLARDHTKMSDGTTLAHHTLKQCSGACCLHGSSPYITCALPMTWRSDRKIIEHHCDCGIGHPCQAGIAYSGDDDTHGCCMLPGHCGTERHIDSNQQAMDELRATLATWMKKHNDRTDDLDIRVWRRLGTFEQRHRALRRNILGAVAFGVGLSLVVLIIAVLVMKP